LFTEKEKKMNNSVASIKDLGKREKKKRYQYRYIWSFFKRGAGT